MKNRLTFLLGLVFSVIVLPQAQAGGISVAKYAGDFMSNGVGARALGMGGAYTALTADGTAAYWNPAGLARMNYPQLNLMHVERFSGIVKYDFLGVARPFGEKATLAFSLVRSGVDDIPITAVPNPSLPVGAVFEDANGNKVRNMPFQKSLTQYIDYVAYLSYARAWRPGWFYGGNVKIVYKGVASHSAWGLGFDFGIQGNPWRNLWVGANLQDATTTFLAWDTGRTELIVPTLRWGGVYPVHFYKFRLLPALDVVTQFEGIRYGAQVHVGGVSFDFHPGAELAFKHLLYFRVGSSAGHFSAGAGFHLPRLNIDYAFLSHKDLGNTHQISLALTFEDARFKRR